MIFAALWTPVIRQFDTIVEYFQSFLGYVTMPVVVILLGGLFWPRGTKQAAFWTIVVAGPIGFTGFLTGELLEVHDLQFLYGTGLMVLLSTLLFVGIGCAPRRRRPRTSKGSRGAHGRGGRRARSSRAPRGTSTTATSGVRWSSSPS
jgi:solute:Na+ symporter, SSS family